MYFVNTDYTNFILWNYVLGILKFQILLKVVRFIFHDLCYLRHCRIMELIFYIHLFLRIGFCNLDIVKIPSWTYEIVVNYLKIVPSLSQVLIAVLTEFKSPMFRGRPAWALESVYGFKMRKTIFMHRYSIVPSLIAASAFMILKLVTNLTFWFQIPQGRTCWRTLFKCVTLLQEDHSRIIILLCTLLSEGWVWALGLHNLVFKGGGVQDVAPYFLYSCFWKSASL